MTPCYFNSHQLYVDAYMVIKLYSVKLKIYFLSHDSHISSVKEPRVIG